VFEKEIEKRLAVTAADGEKQVRVDLLEAGFDEGAGEDSKRWPVNPRSDGRGQVALEKRDCAYRLGEHGFEKPVIGVSGGCQWVCGIVHDRMDSFRGAVRQGGFEDLRSQGT